jgi:hypothetical protein
MVLDFAMIDFGGGKIFACVLTTLFKAASCFGVHWIDSQSSPNKLAEDNPDWASGFVASGFWFLVVIGSGWFTFFR